MDRKQLVDTILQKKSYLCIGLDTDPAKIPTHLLSNPDPVFEFNRQIIDATKDLCVSYKINTAFYEAHGVAGWTSMLKTVDYIPATHFKIADAKRGDIGNTSAQYAKAFFETMNFDAITVAPYMGEDSIRPFLEYDNKWTILLGLTSNAGARDFELLPSAGGHVYEQVLLKATKWGNINNLMFVIGATQAALLDKIRALTPKHFYLVPGVGAQGGSLTEISRHGLIPDVGLLINVSRAVIYAGPGVDFAERARLLALSFQQEMVSMLV